MCIVGLSSAVCIVGLSSAVCIVGLSSAVCIVGLSSAVCIVGLSSAVCIVGLSSAVCIVGLSSAVCIVGLSSAVCIVGLSSAVCIVGLSSVAYVSFLVWSSTWIPPASHFVWQFVILHTALQVGWNDDAQVIASCLFSCLMCVWFIDLCSVESLTLDFCIGCLQPLFPTVFSE